MIVAIIGLATLLAVSAFLYWLIILTEGTYLGPWLVAFLYDRIATRYDTIKDFDELDDAWRIGKPLQETWGGISFPLVLDVATGTGRAPLILMQDFRFRGRVVGLDVSLNMLRQAWQKTRAWASRLDWVWQEASLLPFSDEVFDAVTCLEALEFLPSPRGSLQEMARVLRPGGMLLISNRVGRDALFFPGRIFRAGQLRKMLESLSLDPIRFSRWQEYYDLVWARKKGEGKGARGEGGLAGILCCPECRAKLIIKGGTSLSCPECGRTYLRHDGVVLLRRWGGAGDG